MAVLDRCLDRGSVDIDATTGSIETDIAVDERVQGVIAATTHISTGMKFGANLADDDAARSHYFAAKTLDAASLTVTVATVTAAALAFLMCHDRFLILRGKSLVFYNASYDFARWCSSRTEQTIGKSTDNQVVSPNHIA